MEPSTDPTDPTDATAAALAEIQQAGMLAFGGIGFASRMPAEAEAYYTLRDAISDGADLRAELTRLVEQATPAGRLYAAQLLEQVDPAAAAQAWQQLSGDQAEVQTGAGCIIDATTVAEYAAGKQPTVS